MDEVDEVMAMAERDGPCFIYVQQELAMLLLLHAWFWYVLDLTHAFYLESGVHTIYIKESTSMVSMHDIYVVDIVYYHRARGVCTGR